ncbi:hypothetical protein Rs2_06998 [Raphanus sativus]|uniref:Uncharacterized protein LOC108842236 n=1 Tax=Raphanus sativus TaxID=3726 RepID=A0A6J0MER1_RAPSA|nr:uncharacterized protein LOC108842236 [Raphanus sativus]KAJ4912377.1 hypothetical protein Rs2_06998 [Raphanus sativus]
MEVRSGLRSTSFSTLLFVAVLTVLSGLVSRSESAQQPFRREPGHPHWHHSAFLDVRESVRSDVRRMLHSRAEVPFQVPLEVNIVLVGMNGDGGYRYAMDPHKLEEFLRVSFSTHRPSCQETGEPLDIEHRLVYNVFPVGQPELIALEKTVKESMVPAGTALETDFGRQLPAYDVEATKVESAFNRLYSYIFDTEVGAGSAGTADKPIPSAIFVVNFDKVRMDPRNTEIDLDSLMFATLPELSEADKEKQEADYIYRYRYNGGGASQVWLGSGRYVVIDLSAGPCTYGKIETEEGSVSPRTLPRIRNIMLPGEVSHAGHQSTHDIFSGQLAALVATTIEHVIAPDVRFETVDLATRVLVPIIVLQNHNRYNIMERGQNYSINIEEIESEVKKMIHHGQEVVIVGGAHPLHRHEKLAIAVSKAMRGHSLQETKTDGRFHVHTKTYLDGAILKEEMERSTDVLAAGLLDVSDPELSNKYFLRQSWEDESEGSSDSIVKHKPLWSPYSSKHKKGKKKKAVKKKGDLYRTYGTRVIPVFILSLADVDPKLMMEDESLVWASSDVVIVLQHLNEKIPLSYVSETERQHAIPSHVQRHILAGIASALGGVSAPYEKTSHAHERPVTNWLWAAGCHPFGPFSNVSQMSQMLQDVALRNTIYARVDSALHKIRETSEAVQNFASEYLKTPLGEPVKDKKNKTKTELWVEKFYKKTTTLPEPFPHELVERLEKYLDSVEEQLVDLSSLLYDHKLYDAHLNSSEILQTTMFTQQYVEHVLETERENMRCCKIEYKYTVGVKSYQTLVYGGILIAGFLVYFLVIFFSSPPAR